MPVSLASYNLFGLHADPVSIQVEVSKGMPHFSITGMAGASIREAKDRIRSAIECSGFRFPKTRKIIHLAPADFPKRGSHLDLPMAIGLLSATSQIATLPNGWLTLGELELNGGVRAVRGVLPGLLQAKALGVKNVIIPEGNLEEAALIKGLNYYSVSSLREAVKALKGLLTKTDTSSFQIYSKASSKDHSLDEVKGQRYTKRALMLAAAGGHHVLMHGPPGTGKTLLARGFPSLLPALNSQEKIEIMSIHSVLGLKPQTTRPFRCVHHSISRAQLMGGGALGRPGELSLAHKGVLYLDELPEFDRSVLESLRQPLEEGEYHMMRQQRTLRFPSRFQLIASMNPCPCGYYGDSQHPCQCHPYELGRYRKKLSGPLMDRIDIFIHVPRLPFEDLHGKDFISASFMSEKVQLARKIQYERQGKLNQELSPQEIRKLPLQDEALKLLESATNRLHLSGRAVFKVIRLAQSIADIAESGITPPMIAEALSYRRAF